MAKLAESFPLKTIVRSNLSGALGWVTGYEGRRVQVTYTWGETFAERPAALSIQPTKGA